MANFFPGGGVGKVLPLNQPLLVSSSKVFGPPSGLMAIWARAWFISAVDTGWFAADGVELLLHPAATKDSTTPKKNEPDNFFRRWFFMVVIWFRSCNYCSKKWCSGLSD